MNFLETVPAIRRIDTDRDDLFAIDVVGDVTGADAENLFGLLEAACALHSKIDVLVRLVELGGVDWSNVAGETLTQGTTLALRHVGRCATIGEPDWTSEFHGLLAKPLPVDLKYFKAEDEAAAWKWLGAVPIARR
ncbi:MAG: STAS/SEC14 domain-containing protein [Mesorhizobium sp.]|uniref:STAS/SEC14 domain-containing protein n=1 Tax=Mesorhizobium sp. TaxID=1871066 RepID=UPI000FD1E9AB|nr:STAS/SEC14 domain-containing protein [Mesorhizobium sp.]RVD71503.1 STAS/SEC14 domain-containing protein [Mesorhizobium sp. M4A.F.Ca.ET.029.04.2.1]TIW36608.1 MAG: STAS/SEC14 domain-containing protein [Mesorhizobium sp.]